MLTTRVVLCGFGDVELGDEGAVELDLVVFVVGEVDMMSAVVSSPIVLAKVSYSCKKRTIPVYVCRKK